MSEATIQELYTRCAELVAERDALRERLRDYVAKLRQRADQDLWIRPEVKRIAKELEALLAEEGKTRPILSMTAEELRALPEYSSTYPTGTTLGKRWKCNIHPECNGAAGYPPERCLWVVGEYYDIGRADRIGIRWYDVALLEEGGESDGRGGA